MSAKLDVPIASLRLNLLESHHEHCPWKNAVSQANSPDGPIADMPAWQTLQFIILQKNRDSILPRTPRHGRNTESVDLAASEVEYPRGSMETFSRTEEGDKEDETGKLEGKWKKFKAKLRRTTSKKSLKSTKSIRSVKSGRSTATGREVEE